MQYRIIVDDTYNINYIGYIKRGFIYPPILVASGGMHFYNLKKARKIIRMLKIKQFKWIQDCKIRFNIVI